MIEKNTTPGPSAHARLKRHEFGNQARPNRHGFGNHAKPKLLEFDKHARLVSCGLDKNYNGQALIFIWIPLSLSWLCINSFLY
jgi:hypothetical protein